MPFYFSSFCSLLQELERLELRDPPLLPKGKKEELRRTTEQWFKHHRREIDRYDTNLCALLSAFFPAKRTDRVYAIQEPRLIRIIARVLSFNAGHIKRIQDYRTPGLGGLGGSLEAIMKPTDTGPQHMPGQPVTLEEIDQVLHDIASHCRFSAPEVKAKPSATDVDVLIRNVILRMQSVEAKWFVRMILKDYHPVNFDPPYQIWYHCHFMLPYLLKFHGTFEAAVKTLRTSFGSYPAKPGDAASARALRKMAVKELRPVLGSKACRPHFLKARSIKNCLDMVGSKRWLVERKYDGEYCEIHIDLSKTQNPIRIFSKSGKDSTEDRKGVHKVIKDCLRLGRPDCKLKTGCILLGELLVYNDKDNTIAEFHKIRKHVSRSGSFLGADVDSQQYPYEHLMIMFYDALMIDDDVTMNQPIEERRKRLKYILNRIPGRAMTGEYKIVDFSAKKAETTLIHQFAASIANRCEGLVLKPCEGPLFVMGEDYQGDFLGTFIKLKKDYIQGLGDSADFAIIGASYDPSIAKQAGSTNIKCNTFYMGCMVNKPQVLHAGARPLMRVMGNVTWCLQAGDLQTISRLAVFRQEPYSMSTQPANFDIVVDSQACSKMQVTFKEPFVFEILGSGFDKPPNSGYFMLRHPRLLKIHWDRDWKDSVSFNELQELADEARKLPEEESKETNEWIKRLLTGIKKHRESQRTTPSSTPVSSGPTLVSSPISTRTSPRTRSPSKGQLVLVRMDTGEMRGDEDPLVHVDKPVAAATPLREKNASVKAGVLWTAPVARHAGKPLGQRDPNIPRNHSAQMAHVVKPLLAHALTRTKETSAVLSTSARACEPEKASIQNLVPKRTQQTDTVNRKRSVDVAERPLISPPGKRIRLANTIGIDKTVSVDSTAKIQQSRTVVQVRLPLGNSTLRDNTTATTALKDKNGRADHERPSEDREITGKATKTDPSVISALKKWAQNLMAPNTDKIVQSPRGSPKESYIRGRRGETESHTPSTATESDISLTSGETSSSGRMEVDPPKPQSLRDQQAQPPQRPAGTTIVDSNVPNYDRRFRTCAALLHGQKPLQGFCHYSQYGYHHDLFDSCLLQDYVVYVDPNVAARQVDTFCDLPRTSCTLKQMLEWHGATLCTDLNHWIRETAEDDPMGEIVSESQSYPGLKKMVLVDCLEYTGFQTTPFVQRVVREMRETVQFYNWTVVEDLARMEMEPDETITKGAEGMRKVLEANRCGEVRWAEELGHMMFYVDDKGDPSRTYFSYEKLYEGKESNAKVLHDKGWDKQSNAIKSARDKQLQKALLRDLEQLANQLEGKE